MTERGVRRFIAGAVCPSCKAQDKIVVDLDSDERHCVSCGFSEGRPGSAQSRELPTRVSRARARRVETPAERITLLDEKPDPAGRGD